MNLISLSAIFSYYVLLARFPRGQLQPVVFSLSCSFRSHAKILLKAIVFYIKMQMLNFNRNVNHEIHICLSKHAVL
ncbi:hypothetical protein BUZ13_06910 [Staphylococcus gallinarum]|nr:hypothetical protein BUZ13_06910 [Staphylococcus gallinarum]